jgi:hypothetical protein
MIISDSNLQFSSSRSYLEYQRREESLTAWNRDQTIQMQSSSEQFRFAVSEERLTLSAMAQQPASLLERFAESQGQPGVLTGANASGQAGNIAGASDATVETPEALNMMFLRLMIEQLTGRSAQVFDARELETVTMDVPPELANAAQQQQSAASRGTLQGWGIRYNLEETYRETETTQFTAKGVVRTADGKEIEMHLELNMSREYASHQSINIRSGDALKDPLVINFNGNAAQLSQTTFKFDLDADGTLDNMRFVGPGSGFLALDKNGDGKINDGHELFGALNGDGFADLAQYDDDGNGWIDEADAIFDKLRVWIRDDQGNEQLLGLLQLGVGALHLGKTGTEFALKDSSNNLQGAIRASGIYLREDGGMGTLQQIDIAV